MRFAAPLYLYFLLFIPVLVGLIILSHRRKKQALQVFGNPELIKKLAESVSRRKQVLKSVLWILGILCLVIALARPQLGTKLGELKRKGVDIIVVLDTSESMLAEDIKPNRLEKAKHEISKFIDLMDGDRIGLVAFAGTSFVQCPLTLDANAAKLFLDIIDTDIIPTRGTAIADALGTAAAAFNRVERKYKVIILLTDGEDHEGEPVEAAIAASKDGIIIYTIGIGSPKGEPIPLKGENREVIGYKKDRQGTIILSKLDEETLQKIALETGGKYHRASHGELELEQIYAEISNMEKKELKSKQFVQYEERYQYFLGIAILLILIESTISDRKNIRRKRGDRYAS